MASMSRTTLILAAALLAAAPAAHGQSGSGGAAARPVDECGSPTGRRARRTAEAAAAAAARPAPRLLGVRQDSAATQGAGSTGSPAAAAGSAATSTAGSSQPMASSTAADGSAVLPSATPGTAASATSGAGQTMTSSTSASGSAVSPAGTGSTAASSMSSGSQGTTAAAAGATGRTQAHASADTSTGPIDPRAAARNRAAMRLGLGPMGDQVRLGPAASVSVPTALGVDAGELFFGVAYQGRTRYTNEDDAAAVIGLGLGTRRVLALEAALTTYSTFRSAPLETGGLSLKLHRVVPGHSSIAVGYENALLWGGSDDDGSLYAVASRQLNLRERPAAPFSTAVVSLGVGNGRFRSEQDDAEDNETVNLFAAAGVRVAAPLSLVADWTGQDLNAAASITPFLRLPLVITAGVADITGSAGDGARLIFSLGYGLAFPQPF